MNDFSVVSCLEECVHKL